jgi:hypothetical protein
MQLSESIGRVIAYSKASSPTSSSSDRRASRSHTTRRQILSRLVLNHPSTSVNNSRKLHRPSGYFRGLEEIEKISLPSGSSVYFEQSKQALWAEFLDEVQRAGFVEQ